MRSPRSLDLALLGALVLVPQPLVARVSELFFSEYVEGSSNNKAIEIYNNTGATVDLAAGDYRLEIFFDQNTQAETVIDLAGLVADGDVFVVADVDVGMAIQLVADQVDGQNFWNGNDSLVLYRGTTVIDSFGRIGELGADDEEWIGGGVRTKERTLRRKPEICGGDPDPDDPFDPSLQWEAWPRDTFDGLGRHQVANECLAVPDSCTPRRVLDCATPRDAASNRGGERVNDAYPCLAGAYGGREFVYSFTPPADGTYSVALRDLEADLDLLVLGPGRCEPGRCLAASDVGQRGEEALSWSARGGEEYFIVIDAAPRVISDFTVELTCPAVPRADFLFAPEFPTAGQPVRFFDLSSGTPSAWRWDFGDDSGGRGRSPSHVYAAAGVYEAAVEAQNAFGLDRATRQVIVADPDARLVLSGPARGQAPGVVTLRAAATGCAADAAGYRWSTAAGEIVGEGTGEEIRLRWSAAGVKVVSVANRACGAAVANHRIEILPAPDLRAPAAPTDFVAVPRSATEIDLAWTDNATSEEGFEVEIADMDGLFAPLARFPAETTAATVSVAGRPAPVENPSTLRVRAVNRAGASPPSADAVSATAAGACDPARSLCLLGKRFAAEVEWEDFAGRRGRGRPVGLTGDTGYFWFFDPDNVELVVKVLDGREVTGHYWVFYGSLSNVAFTLRIVDTLSGNVKVFTNPRDRFASVGDVAALPAAARIVPGTGWHPRGEAPGIDFAWDPRRPSTGSEVLFTDSSPSPPDFAGRGWDFGDGEPRLASGDPSVRHPFARPGTYEVTLEVVDLAGDVFRPETRSKPVEITPPPVPEIELRGPRTARLGVPVSLAASLGEHCVAPRPRGFLWELAGGETRGAAQSSTVDVTWRSPGPKTVTVQNAGCPEAVASHALTVEGGDIPPPARCEPGPETLCLHDNRFRVGVRWRTSLGETGNGRAVRLTPETGYFWFFNESNVELVLKILDGRPVNGFFWVFYGALSDVAYEITVEDVQTGRVETWSNPLGRFASVGDTAALRGE